MGILVQRSHELRVTSDLVGHGGHAVHEVLRREEKPTVVQRSGDGEGGGVGATHQTGTYVALHVVVKC